MSLYTAQEDVGLDVWNNIGSFSSLLCVLVLSFDEYHLAEPI